MLTVVNVTQIATTEFHHQFNQIKDLNLGVTKHFMNSAESVQLQCHFCIVVLDRKCTLSQGKIIFSLGLGSINFVLHSILANSKTLRIEAVMYSWKFHMHHQSNKGRIKGDFLVLCKAAEPKSCLKPLVSFSCQKLLEASICKKEIAERLHYLLLFHITTKRRFSLPAICLVLMIFSK